MTFPRPTLSQLRDQTRADIESALPGADVLLRYSNLSILANVTAALANGHYGYLDWIARQSVPFTATDEALEGWAALKGVIRKPATPASGAVQFSGAPGASLPDGTMLLRNDGYAYVSTGDVSVGPGGMVVAQVQAVTAGAAGNAATGTAFTLANGVSGIASAGAAFSAIGGGADLETDDDFRSRMLAAYAAPAQGGNAADYENWALGVPGVTRAWAARTMGLGTVTVYFMMDVVRAAGGGFPVGTDGVATAEDRDLPATGDQLLIADALYSMQPLTPIVYAVAPRPNTLTLTISGLATASASVKAAVSAAVSAALLLEAAPGGSMGVIAIEAAIATVSGTGRAVLMDISASAGTVSPGSTGNITADTGCLTVLGAINYV